jgi:hypothetical protein
MLSVETQVGIRMKDFGRREPLSYKLVYELPGDPTPLAATTDHPQPELAHLETKIAKTGYVAGNSMIVEVALYHAPQPFPNFRQWLMHQPQKYLPDLLQFGQESLTDGLAQHEEFAVLPGLSTNMREPQKVKCFPFPRSFRFVAAKRPNSIRRVLSG